MKTNTALVHSNCHPKDHASYVSPPIYKGSTVIYPNVYSVEESLKDGLKLSEPRYGRFGSPSTRALERLISEIEGGFDSVTTCSGLSAITTAILAFARSGTHMLVVDSVYTPTKFFCDSLKNFGIEIEYFNPSLSAVELASRFKHNTRLVFLESPGSLTFEVMDIPAIAKVCREKSIVTLIDNTWATPLFFHPLQHGIDVSVHSGTKYITGHAESFLGVIVCSEETFPLVRSSSINIGQHASAEDIHSGLLGMKTLSVRLNKHQEQAASLIEWLIKRPEVKKILSPTVKGSPGHEFWKRDFTGATGLFSFVLNEHYSKASINSMLDSLKYFGLGHSWGGYESLIIPANPSVQRVTGWDEPGEVLRVHVGFEDLEDLKADLANAFLHLV